MTLLLNILSSVLLNTLTTTPPPVAHDFHQNFDVHYEWKEVDYTFPTQQARENLINSKGFVPVNCAITAVKIYQDVVFVATPRYLTGVPATLSIIPYWKFPSDGHDPVSKDSEGPKLTPFPSWEMQQEGNCQALQLVQAMELDPYQRLWIVDVGRTEILTSNPLNLCPAKLVIFDLNLAKIDRVYHFPEHVVPRESNVIKDIQISCTNQYNCYAYISNLNATSSLVVYDYWMDDSWYAKHPTMLPDPTKNTVTIDTITAPIPFGITGLGLTPRYTNYSNLYFSKLAGDRIYSIHTWYLQDAAALKKNPVLPDRAIQDMGVKPMGQADGGAMDNWGRWFFGSLPDSAVYSIDVHGNPQEQIMRANRVAYSRHEMEWPDTFTFDGQGNLVFTTTRFHRYLTKTVNSSDVNYRLIRIRTDSLPYYI